MDIAAATGGKFIRLNNRPTVGGAGGRSKLSEAIAL